MSLLLLLIHPNQHMVCILTEEQSRRDLGQETFPSGRVCDRQLGEEGEDEAAGRYSTVRDERWQQQ